jgi:dTDP-4-dehydrorhamnose reductase
MVTALRNDRHRNASKSSRLTMERPVNGGTVNTGSISKKVLITGASGRVGTELRKQLGEDDIILKPRESLDISNASAVNTCISAVRPDIVINTASAANSRHGNLEDMWATNVAGVSNLVNACANNGVPVIHLSTGDVFGGFFDTKPRAETDSPMCLSPYLQSRLAGEHAFFQAVNNRLGAYSKGFRYWLIRTSMLYSSPDEFRGGFVHELLKKVAMRAKETCIADDVVRSPTYVPHLVKHLLWLVDNRRDTPSGVYHINNEGSVSLYDMAHFILSRIRHTLNYQRCNHAAQAVSMGVTTNSLARAVGLCTKKWDSVCAIPLLDWRESMEEFLLGGGGFAR